MEFVMSTDHYETPAEAAPAIQRTATVYTRPLARSTGEPLPQGWSVNPVYVGAAQPDSSVVDDDAHHTLGTTALTAAPPPPKPHAAFESTLVAVTAPRKSTWRLLAIALIAILAIALAGLLVALTHHYSSEPSASNAATTAMASLLSNTSAELANLRQQEANLSAQVADLRQQQANLSAEIADLRQQQALQGSIITQLQLQLSSLQLLTTNLTSTITSDHTTELAFQRQICSWFPATNVMPIFQSIPTSYATRCKAFVMNNATYLAIANYPSTAPTSSNIYVFDTAANQFVLFQSIVTSGGYDFEYFAINGTDFLAVADDGSSTSSIYRFDATQQQFVLFQQVATQGGYSWASFQINGSFFLVVANSFDGSSNEINSVLYKYSVATDQFEAYQQIPTVGAVDWKYFTMTDGRHYLVVANYRDGGNFIVNSTIYVYNSSSAEFDVFQRLLTSGAYDWEHFVLDGVDYLVVANLNDNIVTTVDSTIFKFDSAQQTFVVTQQIATVGAADWEYFELNNASFLVVANSIEDSASMEAIDSVIYRYDDASAQFIPFQTVLTDGATKWQFFALSNGYSYLAVSNNYDDSSGYINSNIYQLDPLCFV